MLRDVTCPRCGDTARPPGGWSDRWTCTVHGEIYPVSPVVAPNARQVHQLIGTSTVPWWLPWPLPRGWIVGGLVHAGDDVSGIRASAVVVSGPNPLGGPGDLALVAEEPGVGLGAGLAGLEHADPGTAVECEPQARIHASGRAIPLWWVDAPPGQAVYAGHWGGFWLWAILRPETAAALLLEDLDIADMRDLGHEVDLLPFGSPPPWLKR